MEIEIPEKLYEKFKTDKFKEDGLNSYGMQFKDYLFAVIPEKLNEDIKQNKEWYLAELGLKD